MQTNTVPKFDLSDNETGCCPRFDPVGWDGRELRFDNKLFVRATTKSILHVPLNMGRVFTRVQEHIEDAGAQDPDHFFVLSRDVSASEAEHFFAVTCDVPEEEMVRLSGTYMTRVFEGPYRRAKDWVHDMDVAAIAAGRKAREVFMFYTTCPKCARAYGRNYVIGVARID